MKIKIAIFISGRGSNMEALAKSVESGELKDQAVIKLVVCNREEAEGIEKAHDLGLPVKVIPSAGIVRKIYEETLIATLKPLAIDFVILAGFNRILSPYFIDLYRDRIINIHPADTLIYQGSQGYRSAFESKRKETKITIHFVDYGVDTGQIIAQESVDLSGAESLEEVMERGLKVEHELYCRTLKKVFLNFLTTQKKN
jgi:phosphoribosylglycinamide formyltransferase-1